MCRNLEHLQKTFSIGKKSDFKLKIWGIFGKKKIFNSFETSVIISLKKDNLPYLAIFQKKKIHRKIFQLQVSKSGVFSRKKNEITIGRRPFFERTSEAKCPEKLLASLENPLVDECGRRMH